MAEPKNEEFLDDIDAAEAEELAEEMFEIDDDFESLGSLFYVDCVVFSV